LFQSNRTKLEKHILDSGPDLWILPIEIRLLGCEEGKKVFIRHRVVRPLAHLIVSTMSSSRDTESWNKLAERISLAIAIHSSNMSQNHRMEKTILGHKVSQEMCHTALFASPRICDQLFGGNGFPALSRRGFFQMYQERFGLVREERDSRNHSCCCD